MKRLLPLLMFAGAVAWLSPAEVTTPVGRAAPQDSVKKAADQQKAKAAVPAAKKADAAPRKAAEVKVAVPALMKAAVNLFQPDADAALALFEQQFGPPFRVMYRSELHYMRMVCQPTKEQYEKIAAEGEVAMKATRKKLAEMWQQMQQGRMAANDHFDARASITDGLAKAVRATLPAEQADRYQRELDQRTAARKKATVLNLVAMVDQRLVLTPQQRAQLSDVFEKNWHPSWNETQILMYGGMYLPDMPDAKMLPILTEAQKAVWQSLPKQRIYFGIHGQFNNLRAINLGDEVWNEDSPQEGKNPVENHKAAAKAEQPAEKASKK